MRSTTRCDPLEAKPGAEPGTVSAQVHLTHADELDALVAGVQAAHTGAWSTSGC